MSASSKESSKNRGPPGTRFSHSEWLCFRGEDHLNQYEVRKLVRDVEQDVTTLKSLYGETAPLADADGKLERLKELLENELRGKKVLVFSSFKDTARYVHRVLTSEACSEWHERAGGPVVRRIDSGNHPEERGHILGLFAPVASGLGDVVGEPIDVLVSTDVLSEGQNLQDCGVIINYDLTWNPIRLVQRNGRIDRLGTEHTEIGIYNLFPEAELEDMLRLIERLTDRISTIDDLGLLDASVLGEVVHPRTFNTLRRVREEDGAVLDEEEARAELAGPELLLKQLKESLSRDGGETPESLPNGIHSGLRRQNCNGLFFYFQAPRSDGEGVRHFWRYVDASTGAIRENRYEIAQLIACRPDEPRYIGPQEVFKLQQQVIEHILAGDKEAAAKAAAPTTVDPIQQVVAEQLKDFLRKQSVDRETAKAAIRFLSQPVGKSIHAKLRSSLDTWRESQEDDALCGAIKALADEFSRESRYGSKSSGLHRDQLTLICFEYLSS
ncbi:C-terminal helicase domain-containing protein [Botrimarina hoheduenensis]|uniref:C-terminal helicase domain-containing protein n=1 Tax=Botrimarina hoheduenensis TaxID=2528000 RepID=UPI0011B5C453|nr:C-terminal helicase domain-containing protein [Botrimarina hoheduenensis]